MKTRSLFSAIFSSCILSLLISAQTQQSQAPKPDSTLMSLVNAERAFAKMGAAEGVRESFMAYFADDGINFQPHPTNTIEAYRKQPAPTAPEPFTLNWEPIFGGASSAGDLGYTTGPYSVTSKPPDGRSPRYGFYFSIWKKQTDGQWKVALDMGVPTPKADAQILGNFPEGGSGWKPPKKLDLAKETASLERIEKAFALKAQSAGTISAFDYYLEPNARFHRGSVLPVLGKKDIHQFLIESKLGFQWEPMSTFVARSADLGYTYGKYSMLGGSAVGESGYYVHVWRRNAHGDWKLVLQVTNALPKESK